MSWPNRIILSMSIFIIATLAFVFFAVNQNFDLVSDNYYNDSLLHDSLLIYKANFYEIQQSLDIKFNSMTIRIDSDSLLFNSIDVYFQRPDNKNKDFKRQFNSIRFPLTINTDSIQNGLWNVRLRLFDTYKIYVKDFKYVK